MNLLTKLTLSTLTLSALVGSASSAQAIGLTGWTTVGNSGVSGNDGVVLVPPSNLGDGQYGWISTAEGVSIDGLGLGSETTGSTITSPVFTANAGDALEFYFNYVTSDGSGYSDYAYAELQQVGNPDFVTLFTARTTVEGDTVPGFGMPPLNSTIVPPSTPIIPGGPTWSPLGGSSEDCYNTGCGYTGWIEASYTVPESGSYRLIFGVVNWNDTAYQSGLAFDGATIAGTPIDPDPNPVPEPLTLLGSTVAIGLGAAFKRRRSGQRQG